MSQLSRLLAGLLMATLGLSACGGGGAGASAGGIAPAPTPTPGSAPAAQPSGAANLSGQLWSTYPEKEMGSFVVNPLTGRYTIVDQARWAMPWPDGSRYVLSDYQVKTDETRVSVRKSANREVVFEFLTDGEFLNVRPAPQGADHFLAYWRNRESEYKLTPLVFDLAMRKAVLAGPTSSVPDALDWLPDGRLLRVRASGDISAVSLSGEEQMLGKVSWFEGREPRATFVSPDGRKALVLLRTRETPFWSDLWMMNIDGSGLRRYTEAQVVTDAAWSPDGRTIAFTKNPGIGCAGGACVGGCSVGYASADAGFLVGGAVGDVSSFPLELPGGRTRLACSLLAWTR